MSQPSVANYFATRKRTAIEENNILRAKKVLVLEPENNEVKEKTQVTTRNVIYSETKEKTAKKELIMSKDKEILSQKCVSFPQRSKVITKLDFDGEAVPKRGRPPKHKKINNQGDIQKMLQTMQNKQNDAPQEKLLINRTNIQKINEKTPPASPKNAMDHVAKTNMSLNDIKTKLTRSTRLAELKASIAKFNKSADQLKVAEKKTAEVMKSPALNKFRSIELEVQTSPKKQASPVKPYLSPMKECSPRKNLFGMKSPIKDVLASPTKVPAYQKFAHLASPGKPTLTLPYHYRHLAEIFRSIDTVCSIIFNRKETITFAKVKPAVQEMTRKNLDESHFAQLKSIYPESFELTREKMKIFGSRNERWELVIKPKVPDGSDMNPTILLERKRTLFNNLIDKVKVYHNEFLTTLDPPMVIPPEKLTRWHPEFDIEKIPDIEMGSIPQPPDEDKLTSGQEVLEKARELFNCNTRMERALEKLKKIQEDRSNVTNTDGTKSSPIANILKNVPQTILDKNLGLDSDKKASSTQTKSTLPTNSILKGIPQSLLEKVRAKQAAKALDAMTRSSNQDKESLTYSRLPDIARLMRNTYVAEKKGVLALEEVINKLNNSYRHHLTNADIEQHLRLIEKSVPGWIVFHEVRGTLFVKLSRDGDMKKVMTRLEQLAKEKSGV